MQFDRKTGEIKILEKKDDPAKRPKKIVQNLDDFNQEKAKLFKEMGLDSEGKSNNTKEPVDKYAEKLKVASERMYEEFDVDPSGFYVFSRDNMRVDCGLIIQRPPIFLTMRARDAEFLKYKNHLMNEYYMDMRQYYDELEDASKLNEQLLNDNPYKSRMNLDNYPTYKLKVEKEASQEQGTTTSTETTENTTTTTTPEAEGGEVENSAFDELEYCAASKHFSKVDPAIDNRRTIHYAGEDRTYLLLRNKFT
jgi:hypothetical protein